MSRRIRYMVAGAATQEELSGVVARPEGIDPSGPTLTWSRQRGGAAVDAGSECLCAVPRVDHTCGLSVSRLRVATSIRVVSRYTPSSAGVSGRVDVDRRRRDARRTRGRPARRDA